MVTLMFLLSVLWQVWVGMRDILLDYIQLVAARLALELLVVLVGKIREQMVKRAM